MVAHSGVRTHMAAERVWRLEAPRVGVEETGVCVCVCVTYLSLIRVVTDLSCVVLTHCDHLCDTHIHTHKHNLSSTHTQHVNHAGVALAVTKHSEPETDALCSYSVCLCVRSACFLLSPSSAASVFVCLLSPMAPV